MTALHVSETNEDEENGEQKQTLEYTLTTQAAELKQMLGDKDKNGAVSNYIDSQLNEAGLKLSELIEFDDESANEIIDELIVNIPKNIYKFPKVLCLTLKREIKSLRAKKHQNMVVFTENKIDKKSQQEINEIEIFLTDNKLTHLVEKFKAKPNLKVNHLITFYEDEKLHELCHQLNISDIFDVTSLKTALAPIAQSIESTHAKVRVLELEIEKQNAEFKQATQDKSLSNSDKPPMTVKLCVLGDSRVGKSSVIIRFVKNEFDQYKFPTIGATFLTQSVSFNDHLIKFEIWDTAGQEKYRSLAPLYTRGACVVIIVYDITNLESFECVSRWLESIRTQQIYHETIVAIVGNKSDLNGDRKVSFEQCQEIFRNKVQIIMETSAKNSTNVKQLFKEIAAYLDFAKLEQFTIKEQKRKATKNRIIVDDVAVQIQEQKSVEQNIKKKCCVI
eukprot:223116_1